MGEYKNIHAVTDNYHKGAFSVIALCPTHEAAEEYIADRIKEDKQKGNNYDYDITEIAIGWDMAEETARAIVKRMEEFKTEYEHYSESAVDYFGGKAEAMGTAITIVKAVFADFGKRGNGK